MLRCNISKIKWYDWQTERGKVKDEWKYSDGHWGTVCDDQWDFNNFFISDVICKMPNYSPPQSSPPPPTHRVQENVNLCSFSSKFLVEKRQEAAFMEETILKQCLKLNSF